MIYNKEQWSWGKIRNTDHEEQAVHPHISPVPCQWLLDGSRAADSVHTCLTMRSTDWFALFCGSALTAVNEPIQWTIILQSLNWFHILHSVLRGHLNVGNTTVDSPDISGMAIWFLSCDDVVSIDDVAIYLCVWWWRTFKEVQVEHSIFYYRTADHSGRPT
jgi:hypothetical protein